LHICWVALCGCRLNRWDGRPSARQFFRHIDVGFARQLLGLKQRRVDDGNRRVNARLIRADSREPFVNYMVSDNLLMKLQRFKAAIRSAYKLLMNL
jgi:hypothetical protein